MMRLRNYFLTGFIVCAPLAITAWITWSFMGWVDSWVQPYIPPRYWPDSYLPFAIPGFGLIVALILITLIGFLTANIIGRTVIGWGERILSRTPLVRTVYMALKQIFETVLADRSTSFKTAALMEYPRKGVWCVVLVATDARGEVARVLADQDGEMTAVFLPPTPNPTSGFLLYVPKKDLRILDMSIENALKLVVSSGLVAPDDANAKISIEAAAESVKVRQSRDTEAAA
ncbi:DUF502 domain-containing protein [Jiella sp. MQZ9-1]|uniref:DUF502 domain-containing protein n=1 Tax=Jiella flava TaxID=2816857 RepID=A0A939FZN9_9HYPH|nr:DUF502 domain-containing protein [Jiella flava]MBO0664452.1 DUF502 domain-containing protein [Jiella flava]MCD2473088.1 DUF502 domain-containing protein [Jiella flava]